VKEGSVHGHAVRPTQGQLTGKQNLHFLGDREMQGRILLFSNLLVGKLEHSFALGMVWKGVGSLVHGVAFERNIKGTVVGELEQPMTFLLFLLGDSFMLITQGTCKLAISLMVASNPLSFAPAPRSMLCLTKSVRDLCSIDDSTAGVRALNTQGVLDLHSNNLDCHGTTALVAIRDESPGVVHEGRKALACSAARHGQTSLLGRCDLDATNELATSRVSSSSAGVAFHKQAAVARQPAALLRIDSGHWAFELPICIAQ
jgi:hypothetical protein